MSNHNNNRLMAALNAVEREPQNPSAHLNLGLLYFLMGRLDEAIYALERAVELDPNKTNPYNLLGAVYFQKLEAEAGIAAFQKALELSPKDDVIMSNLGNLYRHLGRIKEATEAFNDTLRLNPRNASAYLGLAALEVFSGQRKDFDTYITQARECLRSDAYYDHALLAALTKNLDASFEHLSKLPPPPLPSLPPSPPFSSLHPPPRYQSLMS